MSGFALIRDTAAFAAIIAVTVVAWGWAGILG
jgi:hypothetical protein